MKRILLMIMIAAMPFSKVCCQNEWERPEIKTETPEGKAGKEKKHKKAEPEDSKYMQGSVTENAGKVEWTCSFDVPSKSSQELYDTALAHLLRFVKQENQLPESNVSMVNKSRHMIVASVSEWLVFKSSFISLDRARLNYVLVVTCSDNHVDVCMRNINYRYTEDTNKGEIRIQAEESINDKNALNRKGTKLVPGWAKFRKKTIDRKDEVFGEIKKLFLNK